MKNAGGKRKPPTQTEKTKLKVCVNEHQAQKGVYQDN